LSAISANQDLAVAARFRSDARADFYSFFTNPKIQSALFTCLEPGGALLDSCWVSLDLVMLKKSCADIRIDHIHSRAICDEIGERLREALRRESAALPPRLQLLIDRLAELDREVAPSIVPSLEDMFPQRELHSSSV
jgi:hypothetical protein